MVRRPEDSKKREGMVFLWKSVFLGLIHRKRKREGRTSPTALRIHHILRGIAVISFIPRRGKRGSASVADGGGRGGRGSPIGRLTLLKKERLGASGGEVRGQGKEERDSLDEHGEKNNT